MSTSSEVQSKKLKEANEKVKELTACLVVKDKEIETQCRRYIMNICILYHHFDVV